MSQDIGIALNLQQVPSFFRFGPGLTPRAEIARDKLAVELGTIERIA
jgi:hypothetical protein